MTDTEFEVWSGLNREEHRYIRLLILDLTKHRVPIYLNTPLVIVCVYEICACVLLIFIALYFRISMFIDKNKWIVFSLGRVKELPFHVPKSAVRNWGWWNNEEQCVHRFLAMCEFNKLNWRCFDKIHGVSNNISVVRKA